MRTGRARGSRTVQSGTSGATGLREGRRWGGWAAAASGIWRLELRASARRVLSRRPSHPFLDASNDAFMRASSHDCLTVAQILLCAASSHCGEAHRNCDYTWKTAGRKFCGKVLDSGASDCTTRPEARAACAAREDCMGVYDSSCDGKGPFSLCAKGARLLIPRRKPYGCLQIKTGALLKLIRIVTIRVHEGRLWVTANETSATYAVS